MRTSIIIILINFLQLNKISCQSEYGKNETKVIEIILFRIIIRKDLSNTINYIK
jgi:hypothetical protein